MKILVIDDHQLFLDGVVELIRMGQPGAEVSGVSDHHAALDLLAQSDDFDIVLLDLSLSNIDGREVMKIFSAKYPALPIIIISASDSALDIKTCFDCGAMGYVHKSSAPETMLHAILEVSAGNTYLSEGLNNFAEDETATSKDNNDRLYSILRALMLTDRQIDVAMNLMHGKSNKQIARDLDISEGTIKKHISAILKALQVDSRMKVVVRLKTLVDSVT